MKSVSLAVLALATVAGMASAARATVRIGQEAVALRYPAANCSYCHTFDSDHMRSRARKVGLSGKVLQCGTCHGPSLRTGPRILNERGSWMRTRRIRLKAPRVYSTWLADYEGSSPMVP